MSTPISRASCRTDGAAGTAGRGGSDGCGCCGGGTTVRADWLEGAGTVGAGGAGGLGSALSVALVSPFSEVGGRDTVAGVGVGRASAAAVVAAGISTVNSNCPTAALSPA